MSDPVVCILLTTYLRTDYAIKTIQALKQNLQWPQLRWVISDDGSPVEHVLALQAEIGPNYNLDIFNSERKGVGYGMNACLQTIFDTTDLVMIMEDDWVLNNPLDLQPYVNLLMNHQEYGMIRMGYISPGFTAVLISEEGKLFWRLEQNGVQYRYSGHPSLRHKRFHEQYGYYDEGLTPGWTELSMDGKVSAVANGPHIVYPAECGAWGFFGHIGTVSMKDMQPGALL